ncbi:MAG: hypothetical protein WD598_15915 [Acidimicrobiia bacterium]
MTIDELELELRRLDGVHAAGFAEQDDVLCVQVCVDADVDDALVAKATRIAARHAEGLVAVELVRARPPTPQEAPGNGGSGSDGSAASTGAEVVVVRPDPRLELLAMLVFPETNELEVHIAFDGRRIIGRSDADREVAGAVDATLEAVGELIPELAFTRNWARPLGTAPDEASVIVVGLGDPESGQMRYGIARAERIPEAAAKATLHALNRTIARELR